MRINVYAFLHVIRQYYAKQNALEKLNLKVFTHKARRWRWDQTQYFRAACGLRNRTKNKINLYITIPYLQSKLKVHKKHLLILITLAIYLNQPLVSKILHFSINT